MTHFYLVSLIITIAFLSNCTRIIIMNGISCDICDKGLLIKENVRYEVRIEVKSAYDPMELTEDDLEQASEGEMKQVIDELSKLSQQEAEDQVHKLFKFDLCLACQKEFIKNPLKKPNGDQ